MALQQGLQVSPLPSVSAISKGPNREFPSMFYHKETAAGSQSAPLTAPPPPLLLLSPYCASDGQCLQLVRFCNGPARANRIETNEAIVAPHLCCVVTDNLYPVPDSPGHLQGLAAPVACFSPVRFCPSFRVPNTFINCLQLIAENVRNSTL